MPEVPDRNIPFLQIRQVSRFFKSRNSIWEESRSRAAVDDVSLDMERGEIFGLVGESGCGKSTLARIVCRLLAPSSGTVSINGRSIWPEDKALSARLPQLIQMIFQDPASSLNPRMQIGSCINEVLVLQKKGSSAQRRRRVDELLGLVGLQAEQAKNYPHEMSGGQRQRVAIARALAADPQLILCDEPISSLDVSIQAQIINLLKELRQEFGLTYLFISHNLAVISAISDRVGVMCGGRLIEVAPTKNIMDKPAHPYTQLLLASAPDPYLHRPGTRALQLSAKAHKTLFSAGGKNTPEIRLCPFLPRCPQVLPACAETMPPAIHMDRQHIVNCHLYAEKQCSALAAV